MMRVLVSIGIGSVGITFVSILSIMIGPADAKEKTLYFAFMFGILKLTQMLSGLDSEVFAEGFPGC